MELGIAGRKAICCASSRGLGKACAEALAAEGVHVIINGATRERVEAVADEVRKKGGNATPVVADIVTDEGREKLLAACPEPDILVNNNAGPEPRPFVDIDGDAWRKGLESGMISPLLLIRAVLPGMRKRKFGRIVNITSEMVRMPNPAMGLSAGPRIGLTAVSKAVSRESARDNVTINNILPYLFDTDRQIHMAQLMMQREKISWEEARKRQVENTVTKRLGEAREFGATCAFLCGNLAGYICGQNILLDGGNFPGVF